MTHPDPIQLKMYAPNLAEVFTTATNALALAALRCVMTPGEPGPVLRAALLPHLIHIRKCADEAIKIINEVAQAIEPEEEP